MQLNISWLTGVTEEGIIGQQIQAIVANYTSLHGQLMHHIEISCASSCMRSFVLRRRRRNDIEQDCQDMPEIDQHIQQCWNAEVIDCIVCKAVVRQRAPVATSSSSSGTSRWVWKTAKASMHMGWQIWHTNKPCSCRLFCWLAGLEKNIGNTHYRESGCQSCVYELLNKRICRSL